MAKKKSKDFKEMTPTEYFETLKDKKKKTSDEDLKNFYNGALQTVEKLKTTGQKRLIEKLRFLVDCVEKEREIVKLGINTFVDRTDIEEYIDNIANDAVKIIELENYPRNIPDDIVDIIAQTKPYFDQMYVLFTDYTGEVERQVEKDRMEKDPILFGTFQKRSEIRSPMPDNSAYVISDRFYYLGDWVDEYCDLTMDKFIREVGKEKLIEIGTPTDTEEIRKELDRLDDDLKVVPLMPIKEQEKKGFIGWFSKVFFND